MEIRHHNRYPFVPLPERPVYDWPEGKRLAVCLFNNIEWFSFMTGLGSDHTLPGAAQTTRNYAWRDYGNRVGIWYLFDLLDALGLPASHNVNAAALDQCPEIVARIRARGDEVIGHGVTNSERQDVMDEATERAMIAETTQTITHHFAAPPKGWLGPYIVQSEITLDLLKEAGYSYMLDWPADDQPFWMRTRAGPMLSMPYSIELNDSPAQVFRHHTGREFEEMIIDHFDEMLLQSEKYPLVFNIVLHPFVIGQPFRLRALRRALDHILKHRDDLWLTTPGGIAGHIAGLPEGTVP
ncbi:polysaccharide deacetylase family protein [Pseudohalocynthiibacter sp. F2068]|jgi:peptidoglycan/xylan/chitin deacetylase (PgdA/CDA1 family)|uniref:polysaccharide deacetylase family protein n=1 Tax=Pseudohalocynthiibacter sp. F2068 TaxID=2926418 RepID=UPI001FF11B09|nr:polysaccharide deacetylase family protein [Pseudohalocynthiibacter sp. F2068]MCK0100692.1 polysaccharide deacetylase family protein [Pseudohalocynthiibacter sp. F2068]